MSFILNEIQRALFFTDVPDGTLKHNPPAVTDLSEGFSRQFLFDDFQSIGKDPVINAENAYLTRARPRRASAYSVAYVDDMTVLSNEATVQMKSRCLTISPPAVKRTKKIQARKARAKQMSTLSPFVEE